MNQALIMQAKSQEADNNNMKNEIERVEVENVIRTEANRNEMNLEFLKRAPLLSASTSKQQTVGFDPENQDNENRKLQLLTFQRKVSEFYDAKNFHGIVEMFRQISWVSGDIDKDTVVKGILAAYEIQDYLVVEAIFAKSLGDIEYPAEILHAVLSSFYEMSNPISAKQFLLQYWDRVDESMLQTAIKKTTELTKDPMEVVELSRRYRDSHGGVLSVAIYETVLESLIYLDDAEMMIEITSEILKDGLMQNFEINQVFLQNLLLENNEGRIDAFMSLMGHNPTTRPFEKVAKILTRRNDLEGIVKLVTRMDKLGLPVTTKMMNAFLSVLGRQGTLAKIENNIQGWHKLGVKGNNATVALMWKNLLQRFPENANEITEKMKNMSTKYPRLYHGLKPDTFRLTTMPNENYFDASSILSISAYPQGNLYALRKIQKLVVKKEFSDCLSEIHQLIRSNIKPDYQLFSTLLLGLCKTELAGLFDQVYKLMEAQGYKADHILTLGILRTRLKQQRRPPFYEISFSQKTIAIQRIKQFVSEYKDNINLKIASMLGDELAAMDEYDLALGMYDYFRGPEDDYTSKCHDKYSLCGVIRALTADMRLEELNGVLDNVINEVLRDDAQAGNGVVLDKYFVEVLQESTRRIARRNFKDQVCKLQQYTKVVEANRLGWIERDLVHIFGIIENLFDAWEVEIGEDSNENLERL